jgi:hypothetical protein
MYAQNLEDNESDKGKGEKGGRRTCEIIPR